MMGNSIGNCSHPSQSRIRHWRYRQPTQCCSCSIGKQQQQSPHRNNRLWRPMEATGGRTAGAPRNQRYLISLREGVRCIHPHLSSPVVTRIGMLAGAPYRHHITHGADSPATIVRPANAISLPIMRKACSLIGTRVAAPSPVQGTHLKRTERFSSAADAPHRRVGET